tara:strand:+ start:438 stop:728 length:291 start_codon:yes stop_codon:yes gene_type:complete
MRFKISTDQSSSVDRLMVNPITGTARVTWKSRKNYQSCEYRCTRVSRRKILALMLDSDRSLGAWVNRHAQWKDYAIKGTNVFQNISVAPSELTGWN